MDWYYSYGGQTLGPYNEKEMVELIKEGKIKKSSSVKRANSDEWIFITETFLIHYFDDDYTSNEKWFYLQSGTPIGPFVDKELIELFKKGDINSKTLVHKGVFEDDNVKWVKLSDTGLIEAYMPTTEEE